MSARVTMFPLYYSVRGGKPQIDGIINSEEWRGALKSIFFSSRFAAGKRHGNLVSDVDEDNLYVAMRSLREGERLLQGQRRRDRDYNVVWDDSYEFWLDAGSRSPTDSLCFQLLANYAGSRFDCMFEPLSAIRGLANKRMGAGQPCCSDGSA